MSNNCGCNGNHKDDHQCNCEGENELHECGCGHDHDHEEFQTIHLTLEDGTEMDCLVVGTYDINDISYIALVEEEDDQVMIYRFEEAEEGMIDIINIEDDEEFDLASSAFFELFVDGEEE